MAESGNAPSTTIFKHIDPAVDLGNLLLEDLDPLPEEDRGSLLSLARDNAQFLLNKIWELPVEREHDILVAKLPAPSTKTPREKPLPTKLPKTKWEKFSEVKGIHKRKRESKVWDEASQEWKPRWGYRRGRDDTKDWLIEVPDNADPYEDQFEKRTEAKKERVAKNKLQQLRNIARNRKGSSADPGPSTPGVSANFVPIGGDDKTSQQVSQQAALARESTASLGKFTAALPMEKPPKKTGKKRKFESNEKDVGLEKDKHLNILKRLGAGKDKVDVGKAISNVNKAGDSEQSTHAPAAKRPKRADNAPKGGKKEKGSKRTQRRRANNKKQFTRRQGR